MAELAVTDGMPAADDLPQGECFMTNLYDEEGHQTGLCIERADPRILIAAEIIDHICAGDIPWASLDTRDHIGPHALLRIHGTNRTVIYRITEYVPRVHGYIGEWPD